MAARSSIAAGHHRRKGMARVGACLLAASLLAGLTTACGGSWRASGLGGPFRAAPDTVYVIDGSDRVELDGIEQLVRTIGLAPEVVSDVDPAAVGKGLIWVPESARKDRSVATRVVSAVRAGARLVMAGPSDEAVQIGLSFGPQKVELAGERYTATPDLQVTWARPRQTWAVHDPRKDYVADATPDGKNPLAISGSFGSGTFLWMAVGAGTAAAERFPLLPMMLRDLLGQGPSPYWRQGIDLYVDPGSLAGADPSVLADRWVAEGVRRIYIAGWEFGYRSGNAPYDAYIAAAHSRGIAAYAWLEPPEVNDTFYAANPKCHEKTAAGKDATGDWRKLIALEDPTCFALALAAYQQLLSGHDWDGVNIAELYFEGPLAGPDRPDLFTPMSSWVRADFQSKHGLDPAQLFDPESRYYYGHSSSTLKTFMAYREDLVTDLHRRLVEAVEADGLPVVVTTIDDKLAPQTASNVGVSVPALQALAGDLHFEMQYEDPFTVWTQGPRRYDILHRAYPPGTVFDVNVVPRPGGRPTSVPTGSELLVTVAAAAGDTGTLALYAEGTVASYDPPWLPGALSAAVAVTSRTGYRSTSPVLTVTTPFTVRLQAPIGTRSATVDGRPWPLVDERGRVTLPAGTHVVTFSPNAATTLGVDSCSCDITSAATDGSSVVVAYTSLSRAWLLLDRAPARVELGNRELELRRSPSGGVFVDLPAGSHILVAS